MRAAFWWIDRWRCSDSYREMTLAEQGAYRNLCDEIWIRGGRPLPLDEVELAAISGRPREWPTVSKAVLARFVRMADGYHHAFAEQVIRHSKRKAKNASDYRARQAIRTQHHPVISPLTSPLTSPTSLTTAEDPESDARTRAGTGRGAAASVVGPPAAPQDKKPEVLRRQRRPDPDTEPEAYAAYLNANRAALKALGPKSG